MLYKVDLEVQPVPSKMLAATPSGSQLSVFDAYYFGNKTKSSNTSSHGQLLVEKNECVDSEEGAKSGHLPKPTSNSDISNGTEMNELMEYLEREISNLPAHTPSLVDERSHYEAEKLHPLCLGSSPAGSSYLSVHSQVAESASSSQSTPHKDSLGYIPRGSLNEYISNDFAVQPFCLQHLTEGHKTDYIIENNHQKATLYSNDREQDGAFPDDYFPTEICEHNPDVSRFPNCSYQSQQNSKNTATIIDEDQCSLYSEDVISYEFNPSHDNINSNKTSESIHTVVYLRNRSTEVAPAEAGSCESSIELNLSGHSDDNHKIELYIKDSLSQKAANASQRNESNFFSGSSYRFTRQHSPIEFKYSCQAPDVSASGNLWSKYANIGELNDCEFYFSPAHSSNNSSSLQGPNICNDSFILANMDEQTPSDYSSATSSYQKKTAVEMLQKTVDTTACTNLKVINYSFDGDDTINKPESVYV